MTTDLPINEPRPRRDLLRMVGVPAVSLMVCVLVYAYGVHMRRMIVFDEIGLHNPVYTYYTTGRMSYPMHGHPEFMVVHPPTHYAIVAMAMKAGLPLFAAAAVPLIALTAILAAVLVTGPFSAPTAIGLLLGYFVALTTWSEFYTLRPDLHVTAAWFTGLVTLESARLSGWSRWRLFLGSAIAVLAASVHYWGVSALLLPVFYLALVVWQRRARRSWPEAATIVAGGCLVGVPFLYWFVVPFYDPIMQMIAAVQGDGTPADAFFRHLASYEAFAMRLRDGFHYRWLSAALSSPALLTGVPAVFIAVPLLTCWRETRALAQAGAVLPLFVLFLSQGKQIGYTGYFTPEFVLLFAALIVTVLKLVEKVRPQPVPGILWNGAAATLIATIAFVGVPTSMGGSRTWTSQLDTLELLRGAAKRILGPRAAVALTSAAPWYTGGGTYVWNAFTPLVLANKNGDDVSSLLAPFDAVVLDTTWWNGRHDLAPIGSWYVDGRLNLRGFVLPNTPTTRHMMHLILGPSPSTSVKGIFIDATGAKEFVEDRDGPEAFVVLSCSETPNLVAFGPAYYSFAFAYDRIPAPASPSIVLLGMTSTQVEAAQRQIPAVCTIRDTRRGRLTDVALDELRSDPRAERSIQFFDLRERALMASGAPGWRVRDVAMSVAWSDMDLSSNSRRTSTQPLPLRVVPPTQPWAYGAIIPFSTAEAVAGTTIRMEVVVSNTQAGFGLLGPDARDFIVRQFLEPKAEPQMVELTVPSTMEQVGPLIIQNGAREGSAQVVIESVRATRPIEAPTPQP